MSTFTANYNVTGSDRKELVNLVAETIGSPAKYQGAPSFAYTVDYITIDRNGVLSFDNRADTGVIENLLEQLAEHGFTAELPETAPDSPDTAENSEVEEVPGDEEITEHDETVGLTIYLPKDKANIDLLRPWFADASGLSPDEVKAYTAFISALCKLSANAKRVSMTEKPVDNEKYAFRCFLLRLGFIGREHKITRKILLRNLEGSSAFKNGGADDETSE